MKRWIERRGRKEICLSPPNIIPTWLRSTSVILKGGALTEIKMHKK